MEWDNLTIPDNPYFVDDDVVIYHADCRDILPKLPKVDLVLTDPPYGIDYQSSRRTEWQRKPKIHGDNDFPRWIFQEIKFNNAMFVFCRWDVLLSVPLPMPKSFIVWDKVIHGMGDLEHEYGRRWEGIAFYPAERHRFIQRPIDLIECQRINPNDLVHPTEKPVYLLKKLLMWNEGNIILDPFAGSFTTGRAAKDLGRKAIGIEIEEKYCEIAAKRMAQSVMKL